MGGRIIGLAGGLRENGRENQSAAKTGRQGSPAVDRRTRRPVESPCQWHYLSPPVARGQHRKVARVELWIRRLEVRALPRQPVNPLVKGRSSATMLTNGPRSGRRCGQAAQGRDGNARVAQQERSAQLDAVVTVRRCNGSDPGSSEKDHHRARRTAHGPGRRRRPQVQARVRSRRTRMRVGRALGRAVRITACSAHGEAAAKFTDRPCENPHAPQSPDVRRARDLGIGGDEAAVQRTLGADRRAHTVIPVSAVKSSSPAVEQSEGQQGTNGIG